MICTRKLYSKGSISIIQRKILTRLFALHKQGIPAIRTAILKTDLNLTQRQISYNINKLLNSGFVENEAKGIFLIKLTPKAYDFLKQLLNEVHFNAGVSPSLFLDRIHRVTVIQPILKRGNLPKDFTVRNSKNLQWNKDVYCYKGDTYNLELKSNVAVYYLKFPYAIDSFHISHNIQSVCFRQAETLKKDGWKLDAPNIAIIEQHHALSNNQLANYTRKFKIHYKSNKLEFDHSVPYGEFELVDSDTAPEDFLKLTDFFEAIIREEISLNALKQLCLKI